MKLKYFTGKGNRRKKGYVYAINSTGKIRKCFVFDCGICSFDGWWWDHKTQRWFDFDKACEEEQSLGDTGSNYPLPCRSVKAFVRLIRKWSKYVPPGVRFTLGSRWGDFCVEGKTVKGV